MHGLEEKKDAVDVNIHPETCHLALSLIGQERASRLHG